MSEEDRPCLDLTVSAPFLAGNGWRKLLRNTLERLLGIKKIRENFAQAVIKPHPNVFARNLQLADIAIDAKGVKESIPENGGVIVIANHPYGGADAMSLCSICVERRDDSKILANSMVSNAPGLSDHLLSLKILNEDNAARHNLKTLKEASNHVAKGGLLGVFPAGAISKYDFEAGKVTDPEWSEHIARIALKTKAPIVPVFYYGANSLRFQIPSKLNPMLRAALIPRGFFALRNKTIKCRAGSIISHETLAQAENPTAFLREAVYNIEHSTLY